MTAHDELHCPNCGALMKKHWHSLTLGLVGALVKIKTAVITKNENRVHPVRDVELTNNERNNLSKLRYHALIAKSGRGYWLLTRRGSEFLKGKVAIPKRVLTWRNKVVDYDLERVYVKDIFKADLPHWEESHVFELANPEGELAGTREVQLELFS